MGQIANFLNHLKDVASSPFSFVAYVLLLVGWVYLLRANHKLTRISKVIKDLSPDQRASVLLREYGTTPKGITGEQWIKNQKHRLVFFAFLAILFVILVLSVIAQSRSQPGEVVQNPTIPESVVRTRMTPEQSVLQKDWKENSSEGCPAAGSEYLLRRTFLLDKTIDSVQGYSKLRVRVFTESGVDIIEAHKYEPRGGNEVQDEAGYQMARQWWMPLEGGKVTLKLSVCIGTKAGGKVLSNQDLRTTFRFEGDD